MQNQELQSKYIQTKNYSLHVRVRNKTKKHVTPIILVHGIAVSSRYMVPTAQKLAKYYPVYIPDFPGHGKSAKPRHVLTIAECSDVLKELMDALNFKKAIFLGNSYGCQIVVDFAVRYSKRITHAVLVGPTMDSQAKSLWQQTIRLVKDIPYEPLSYFPVLFNDICVIGLRRIIRSALYAINDPLETKLPKVKIPTLIVRGSRDPIVPQQWAEQVKKLLPNGQLCVIPGAGHVVNFNSPKKLFSAVKNFLG